MSFQNYKFYLSFENSLCTDYVSEKLFTRALKERVVPIVMNRADMSRFAPEHTYINVFEYENPKVSIRLMFSR